MKSLSEDLKTGQYKNVYLLYGGENYLKRQYRDRLIKALLPEEDTMNYARFSGKGLSEGEIIDLAETMPFFAQRRVILMEDTGFFKNATEKLADYIGVLPDYLVLVCVESEVDKRGRMFKTVQKSGRATEFSPQDERTLLTWIAQILKREQKNITKADGEYFLSRTGTDMSNIASELEKLICYALERQVITRSDIDAVCTEQIESKIFLMVRAVTERSQKQALELYADLLALKEPPMRILFLLARQYDQLFQVKELSEKGMGQQEISSKLGLRGFIVQNAANCARRYEKKELKQALSDLAQLEEDVKTGLLADTLSVELFLVRYSTKQCM